MAGPIEGLQAQPGKTQSDIQTGHQVSRFGEGKGTWDVLRSKVAANEVEPTAALQLIQHKSHYERMRFAVVIPSAVTGYQVHVGRWILAKGKGVTVNQWVQEFESSKTESHVFEVEIGRDPVGIYIDNITDDGNPYEITVLYQATNKSPMA